MTVLLCQGEYCLQLLTYDGLGTINVMRYADVLQSYMLFRACLLYTHTSMFPYQLAEPGPEFDVCERPVFISSFLELVGFSIPIWDIHPITDNKLSNMIVGTVRSLCK